MDKRYSIFLLAVLLMGTLSAAESSTVHVTEPSEPKESTEPAGQSTTPPAAAGQSTAPPAAAGQSTIPPAAAGQSTAPPAAAGQSTTPPAAAGQSTTQSTAAGQPTASPAQQGGPTADASDAIDELQTIKDGDEGLEIPRNPIHISIIKVPGRNVEGVKIVAGGRRRTLE